MPHNLNDRRRGTDPPKNESGRVVGGTSPNGGEESLSSISAGKGSLVAATSSNNEFERPSIYILQLEHGNHVGDVWQLTNCMIIDMYSDRKVWPHIQRRYQSSVHTKKSQIPATLVNQIRHIAIFGTRAPAYAMRLLRKVEVDGLYGIRRFQEGLRREGC
jgi:hypothetical protein